MFVVVKGKAFLRRTVFFACGGVMCMFRSRRTATALCIGHVSCGFWLPSYPCRHLVFLYIACARSRDGAAMGDVGPVYTAAIVIILEASAS